MKVYHQGCLSPQDLSAVFVVRLVPVDGSVEQTHSVLWGDVMRRLNICFGELCLSYNWSYNGWERVMVGGDLG